MYKSTNDIIGGQRFTLRVARQPSGKFQVTVPTTPELGKVVADNSGQAIREMNDKVAKFVSNGYANAPKTERSLFSTPE